MKKLARFLSLMLVLAGMLAWALPGNAQAAQWEPDSVGTPKITKQPTEENAVEGESVVFIAKADNAKQYIWELLDTEGNTISCEELPKELGKVKGATGEKLTISEVTVALDGWQVRCRFVGAEESVYSEYAQIHVVSVEDALPVVTKDPGKETVAEGETAKFVARADYVKEYKWELVSPSGKTIYDCKDAAAYFEGLKISGYDQERLVLEQIPLSMNGWGVRCIFIGGGGQVASKAARITVTTAEGETVPIPEETEPPTEETSQVPAPSESTPASTEPKDADGGKQGSGSNNRTLLIIIGAFAATISAITFTVIALVLKQNRS